MNDPPQPPRISPPLAEWLPEDDAPRTRRSAQYQRSDPRKSLLSGPTSPEVDGHLRQASLLRVRGDLPGAERELRAALDIDPTSGSVHEMLGDLLVLEGSSDKALDSYRRAQSCGAGAAIEAKIGRLVVSGDAQTHAFAGAAMLRGGAMYYIAAALVPGLGLGLAGETKKALISFFGAVVPLCLIWILPPTRDLMNNIGNHASLSLSPGAVVLFLVLSLANLGFYIYSIVESARVAKVAAKDG